MATATNQGIETGARVIATTHENQPHGRVAVLFTNSNLVVGAIGHMLARVDYDDGTFSFRWADDLILEG